MYQNPWVGDHRGDSSGVLRISPYLFNLRSLLNIFFLPKQRDLPQTGLDLRSMVFDFGFNKNLAGPSIDAFDTFRQGDVARRNMLVWGITGTATLVSGGAVGSPALLFNLFHSHNGSQRQFFNKDISDVEALGTAQKPLILAHPYLILAGDNVVCEVQNLSINPINAQVVLWAGEFD